MDWEGEREGGVVSLSFSFFVFFVCVCVFYGCRGVQQQQQQEQQQWGLQWEKYQQHYGVGLSLPSLSMRGRGLSEHTKGGKRHNPRQRITGGMEGRREEKKERGETTHEELREGQREGLESISN